MSVQTSLVRALSVGTALVTGLWILGCGGGETRTATSGASCGDVQLFLVRVDWTVGIIPEPRSRVELEVSVGHGSSVVVPASPSA